MGGGIDMTLITPPSPSQLLAERGTSPPFAERIGEPLGPSPWIDVGQDRIDAFADATEDHQWLHVDRARAATVSPGTTVAHGFLTLSLISGALLDLLELDPEATVLNYGLDRVRFPARVPAGSRVRVHATILGAEPARLGTRLSLRCVVECEGAERPACVADLVWLVLD
jgi:acyl dehydratase